MRENTQQSLVERVGRTTDSTEIADHFSLDDKLFLAICLTAYHGLMRLGDLVIPDSPNHLNFRKATLC